jgi:hypothetical protein
MGIKWSFSLFDKHLYKIHKAKIHHFNKYGMCDEYVL